MKHSQKLYDSTNINNIINKEHSIHYHRRNLSNIKKRRSRMNINVEELYFSPRKNSNISNPNGKKKHYLFNS